MIDTVGTLSVTSSSARQAPVAVVAAAAASAAASAASGGDSGGASYAMIRVDNLQNAVILEYRSSRTGEVVWQYPTESQIQAFHRAARTLSHAHESQPQPQTSPVSTGHHEAEPHVAAPAAPAPAPVVPSSDGISAPSGDGSTTSVVV
jgi:hypothetical protein